MLDVIELVMAPWALILMLVGTTLGIFIGAIPGLTGGMLIALTIPLTIYMQASDALMLLVAMYVGSVTGGLVSATVLRMPGTPANVMTTLDGFPLAQQGQAGRAISLGIAASFVGSLVSWVFLATISAPIAEIATRFTPWDYFTFVLMALVLIATISQGSILKGFLAAALGALVAFPGSDPSTGVPRLTFGSHHIENGFAVLPVLVGLFAVSQIIKDVLTPDGKADALALGRSGTWLGLRDYRRHGWNMLRSSLLGTWIGILPGIGANVGSVVAYTVAKNASREPGRFGKGSEEGIVASEAANNATVGGALIPLIAMGLPGSVIDAILIGGLILHGIQPGPLMFSQNPEIAYAVIGSCLVASFMMFGIMQVGIRPMLWIARVDRTYLLPVILLLCMIGGFAAANRSFDVWVMLGFGVLGFLLERGGFPLGPFVIAFILTPLAEYNLRTGLMISGGSYEPLFTNPLPLTCLVLSVLILAWPALASRRTWISVRYGRKSARGS